MTINNSAQEWVWYEIRKHYRGGMGTYQIRLPKSVKLSKLEWDELLQWIGEHTNGGHNYGWRIQTRKMRKQHPAHRVLKYPGSSLCASLEGYGEEVVSRRMMI